MHSIACPSCGRLLNVPDEARGRPAKCPLCGHVFSVPGTEAAPVSATPLPASSPPAPPAAQPASRAEREEREEPDPFEDRPRRRRRRDPRELPRFASPEDEEEALYWGRRATRGAAILMYVAFTLGFLLFLLSLFSFLGARPGNRDAMAPSLLCLLIIFLPQFGFVLVGAILQTLVRARGMALAGAIIAVIAGALLLFAAAFMLIILTEESRGRNLGMLWVQMLLALAAAAMNLVAGIRSLIVLGRADVRYAFHLARGQSERRSRSY